MHRFGRVLSIADSPNYQRGAAHEVTGRENAFEAGSEALWVDGEGSVAGDAKALVQEHRQVLRLEAKRGDDEVGRNREVFADQRRRLGAPAGVGNAELRAPGNDG